MSFEEMARTIAEEWEKLPEESKTPYRERADEERLRHEAMSAALVLTQVWPKTHAHPQKYHQCFTLHEAMSTASALAQV